MSSEELLQKLHDVSIGQEAGLNMAMRENLQQFAKTESLECLVYIS